MRVARVSASKAPRPSPTARAICAAQASAGFCQSVLRTKAAVGELCELSATWVRPSRMRIRVSLPAATRGSQPRIRSAAAMPTRVVRMSSWRSPISTWLQVAPPFWARPAASWVTMPLPSRWAATPSNCPMVMTPVPPTPATTMPHTPPCSGSSAGSVGIGTWASSKGDGAWPLAFFLSWPPSTVIRLGQKPLRQEVSLLQLLWLMVRLRPNSVSSGSTLRQLDCTPQSPQPSQTSSLMTTRLAGSTRLPRLRRRRFSVAQVWS